MFYAGDDTHRGMVCGGVSDGQNQIDVTTSSCLNPPNCTAIGWTQPVVNGNNDAVEKDICISGPGASPGVTWAITTPIPLGATDLVGILLHEFGHFAGLNHTANTVMNSANLGGTRQRYPYGDDIDCSYTKWGSITGTRYISKLPPQPASAYTGPQQIALGHDHHFGSTGAVGADNSGQAWFVAGALSTNFTSVKFTRAQHPVTGSPTWLGNTISGNSRRPPAVASRPPADAVHLWGAAWTVEEHDACSTCANGIAVAASSDMFQTVSSSRTLFDGGLGGNPASFVPQEPALFFDTNTLRWGIIFVRSDNTFNDELFATTSPDLVNWTAAQDLGAQSLDAPSASCVPIGFCTATWLNAALLDPRDVTKSFTISPSTGAIVWGSSRQSAVYPIPRNSSVTASRIQSNPGTTQKWLMAITRAASGVMDPSTPKYRIYARQDTADPPGIYDGDNFALPGHPGDAFLFSNHRATIVSDPFSVDWTYIISTL